MIKIEIVAAHVNVKSGTSKAGKPYTINEQEAFAHVVDPNTGKEAKYPQAIRINLQEGQQPFPVGMYTLDPSSLYVGRFGSLEIGRLRLKPLTTAAAYQSAKSA